MTTVDVVALRRWIRRTQAAHRDRAETFGNFYMVVFANFIVIGMVHRQLFAIVWPDAPHLSALAGGSLAVLATGVLFLAMRRLGPLGISRPAATWLLTAPVSRRRLLLPSLRFATATAAVAAGLTGFAIASHALARPIPVSVAVLLPVGAALLGIAVLLVALPLRRADGAGFLAVALGLAGLITDSATNAPIATDPWPTAVVAAPVIALTLGVTAFYTLAVRRLASTPNDRLLEAAETTGTLADSALGVEPSFVTEMVERRLWARRHLRSGPLWSRVPVLVAQDVRTVQRLGTRLLWLAGAVALPLLAGPPWLAGLAILLGGMVAAGTTTANVRTDAGNPVMLRLLGLSSRSAVGQRLWVPGVLAALWSAAALTLLDVLGDLPAGPWWALGLTLGPVGAVAAARKARVGFVDNSLLPLETPMGPIATGPTLHSIVGLDALLLGVPALVLVGQGAALSWSGVLVQAGIAFVGARGYLVGSTSADRVQLSTR